MSAARGHVQAGRPADATRVGAGAVHQHADHAAGVEAIVISANDPTLSCRRSSRRWPPASRSSPSTPTPAPDCRDLFINQATAEGSAKLQVDLIAKQIGDTGEIAILSAAPNATNQNAWIELMKDELRAASTRTSSSSRSSTATTTTRRRSTETAGLLQAYPNLKGIISPTTVGIAAAARYLSSSTYKGKVAADRSRHAEPDAQVRQGRHGRGVRAVEPRGTSGYLAGVRRGRAGRRADHGQARATSSTPARWAPYTSAPTARSCSAPPTVFNKANIDQFNF